MFRYWMKNHRGENLFPAVVSLDRIDEVIAKLRHAIAEEAGLWVCPLVEESGVLDYTSTEDRFKRLRAALGEGVVNWS